MQKLTMQKLKMLSLNGAMAAALLLASNTGMAATTSYQIDPKHTATLFSWSHFGFSNPTANFDDVQGVIKVDDKNPEKSSVSVTIPVKSINSHVEALDKEFLTEAWFNEAKYPNITFKSTKVQTTDKKHFKITGNLTIKGVTKPVVLDATLNGMGEHPMAKKPAIGFNATTSFKRSDFGIAQYVPAVSDEIKVNITTEALAK
jgi:polyisoprenoid-binding protein YceI